MAYLWCNSDFRKIPNVAEKRSSTYTDGVIAVILKIDDFPTKPHISAGKNKLKINLLSECKLFWFTTSVNISLALCDTLTRLRNIPKIIGCKLLKARLACPDFLLLLIAGYY